MKKTKILLGVLSATALAPSLPVVMVSCGTSAVALNLKINKDQYIVKTTTSKTELNRAFYIACECADGYEVDSNSVEVKVGTKTLTKETDFIVYENIIIVSSTPLTETDVTVTIKSRNIATFFNVALYTNDGQFSDGSKSLTLINVAKGTALKDVIGYKEPTSSDGDFAYWIDDKGNQITKESVVTSNMMLGAYYKENVKPTTKTLAGDNWATISNSCSSAVQFAKNYLNSSTSDETTAIQEIKDAITKFAQKEAGATVLSKKTKINIGGVVTTVTIRLIDVNKDKAADESITKTIFTWEFADIIDICTYNYLGSAVWYQEDSETKEVLMSCLLRENCNKALLTVLPLAIQEKIIPVTKETKTEQGGATVKSVEKLFPLSYGEIGLQASNNVINDLKSQGQYQYYIALIGKPNQQAATKFYLGYDGTKEREEGWCPTIQYPMWTRSPNDNLLIWFYNPDTGKIATSYSNSGLGVAPAFCL